jgi:hypothetical protein
MPAMQISGANLLASQYVSQHAAQPKAFAPLDFKQTAPQAQKPAPAPGQPQRPGATLDIRV